MKYCTYGWIFVNWLYFAISDASLDETRDKNLVVPPHFLLGVGSSSYQIEGGWNQDGKGMSIIDYACRTQPSWTEDGSNGDIACDSYNQMDKDVELLKELGVNIYRFSLSWPRILPDGDIMNINQLGITYYSNLIDKLLEANIQPVVTIFHWELPQRLQELGGWTNSVIVDYYMDYVKLVFEKFADRVKWWVTLNEPQISSQFGLGKSDNDSYPSFPPLLKHPGVGEYLAVHNQIKAHILANNLYKSKYKLKFNGKVGIVTNIFNYKPLTNSTENVLAAERAFLFEGGWLLDPLLFGKYPQVMIDSIGQNSFKEGRSKSRLPTFDQLDMKHLEINEHLDFIGLNYYASMVVWDETTGNNPSLRRDSKVNFKPDPSAPASEAAPMFARDPKGLRNVLRWLKKRYGNVPIFITENGCEDPEPFKDDIRISFHKGHMKEILGAMKEDDMEILGYTIWSFMDSFEWSSGYRPKFGVYHVDFSDPKRPRRPKKSFEFFKTFFKNRTFEASNED